LSKIVTAAGQVKSHKLASEVLDVVGEIEISGRHVNRLTEIIGLELAARRDQETEDYVHHRRHPPTVPAPQVVALGLDAARRARQLLGLREKYHKRLQVSGRSANVLRLVDDLFQIPMISISQAKESLGTTFTGAQKIVMRLVDTGILSEYTGRARNRHFLAKEILEVIDVE
jgi:hypothetical protein